MAVTCGDAKKHCQTKLLERGSVVGITQPDSLKPLGSLASDFAQKPAEAQKDLERLPLTASFIFIGRWRVGQVDRREVERTRSSVAGLKRPFTPVCNEAKPALLISTDGSKNFDDALRLTRNPLTLQTCRQKPTERVNRIFSCSFHRFSRTNRRTKMADMTPIPTQSCHDCINPHPLYTMYDRSYPQMSFASLKVRTALKRREEIEI